VARAEKYMVKVEGPVEFETSKWILKGNNPAFYDLH
jgi:hypothetical protein